MFHKMFFIQSFFVVLAFKLFNLPSSGLSYLLNSIGVELPEAKTLTAQISFYYEV